MIVMTQECTFTSVDILWPVAIVYRPRPVKISELRPCREKKTKEQRFLFNKLVLKNGCKKVTR